VSSKIDKSFTLMKIPAIQCLVGATILADSLNLSTR